MGILSIICISVGYMRVTAKLISLLSSLALVHNNFFPNLNLDFQSYKRKVFVNYFYINCSLLLLAF